MLMAFIGENSHNVRLGLTILLLFLYGNSKMLMKKEWNFKHKQTEITLIIHKKMYHGDGFCVIKFELQNLCSRTHIIQLKWQ